MYTVQQYHSDLSDQSALEIRIRFLHFSRRTSTLSSANFTEGNMLLKERANTINDKIKLHIL